MLFQLVPVGFSDLTNQNNYNSNWKKLLGFRNMQEKLEKKDTLLRQKKFPASFETLKYAHMKEEQSLMLFFKAISGIYLKMTRFQRLSQYFTICKIETFTLITQNY